MRCHRKSWLDYLRYLLPATKHDITIITMKLKELEAALTNVNTTLNKVKDEVQALKDSLENIDLPEGAQAALDQLVATTNAIDAINPDKPAEPPAGEPA